MNPSPFPLAILELKIKYLKIETGTIIQFFLSIVQQQVSKTWGLQLVSPLEDLQKTYSLKTLKFKTLVQL